MLQIEGGVFIIEVFVIAIDVEQITGCANDAGYKLEASRNVLRWTEMTLPSH